MSRRLVDEDWLLEYLNTELHKHGQCASCRLGRILRLRENDAAGCNWAKPNLCCSGQPARDCLPVARRVVAEARREFNLRDNLPGSTQRPGPHPAKTAGMLRRMLYIPVLHIDANLINARQKLAPVNQLDRWAKDEVILINMSSTALMEAEAGNNTLRSRKSGQQIFTATPPISTDDPQFKKVETALFPCGARNENQRNDVRIVCEAAKWQAILVTGEGSSKRQPGGILGNRDKLRDMVQTMSPVEAVDFVAKNIRERDDFNRRVAEEHGEELPPWTGRD